jgi:type I restriction enzyme S subunit
MNHSWPTAALRELADIRISSVDKKSFPTELPISLCNYMDAYTNDYVTDAIEFMVATATRSEIERFGLRTGDVVITKDSESPDDIGIPAVISEDIKGLVCGYHLALIRPLSSVLDSIFLSKQLRSTSAVQYFARMASGSTRFGLSIAAIEGLQIPVPPLPEQSRIATILLTVDRAIEQTSALIAKQQRIKTGLMKDLLTCGIDESGNLRSSATHDFKDSPIGRTPAAWALETLNDCVRPEAPICYGILMPGRGYDNGVPVIKVKDIQGGKIVQDDLLLTDPRIDREYKRSRLQAGDLLVTIRGTTGRIAAVPPELNHANITQDTARVRVKDVHCDRFFRYVLQGSVVQDQISLHTIGQAVKGINIGQVKRLLVVVPPRDEQERIADRLDIIEAMLSNSYTEQLNLRRIKTGLMKDLLSGNMRVTNALVEEEASAHE